MPDDAPTLPDPTPHRLLNTLSECAVDLTDLRDQQMVLQGIVRRTRSLLGTDMAYLSLNDLARGETHIEITDGVRTEAYRTIRMPLGTGVLGAVAAGGTDVQTRDYLRDLSMNHLPEIDDIVRGEGVRAIHGCPVRADGRVVAALLVAHRTPVRFTRRQIAALRRLAGFAAVALEPSHAGFDDSLSLFSDDLVERIPDGAEAVCDLLSERLDQPLELHGIDPVVEGTSVGKVRTAIATSLHTGSPVALPATDRTVTVLAVRHHESHVATVLVPVDPLVLGERGRLLMARSAVPIGAALVCQQRLAEAQLRSGADIVEELLRVNRLDADLLGRSVAVGFARRRPVTVLVLTGQAMSRVLVESVARRAAGRAAVATSMRTDEHCVLAQVSDPEVFAEQVSAQLDDGHRDGEVVVGWSVATGGLERVRAAYVMAQRTVTALRALGISRGCADPARLGPAAMLVSGADPVLVEELIQARIGPLLEYDVRRDGRFTETAWVVLECGGRLRDAAERLHVHPNTVRQRSERISALLGPTWRTAPESLDVHFALRLWRVQRALTSTTNSGS